MQQICDLLLIDASYYTFYRYYATRRWYSIILPDDVVTFPDDYDWMNNKLFMDNFTRLFLSDIQLIIETRKIVPPMIWAVDCSGKNNWRHAYIDDYKGTRKTSHKKQKFYAYAIFDYVRQNIIATDPRFVMINHINCEADDIIGRICLKYKLKYGRIIIVASDTDYLQLCGDNVEMVDIKGKVKESELYGEKYLLKKIMTGDTSDNIPSCKVFKCTLKSMSELMDTDANKIIIRSLIDKIAIKEQLNSEILDITDMSEIEAKFYKNMKVIDFRLLPTSLKHAIDTEIRFMDD